MAAGELEARGSDAGDDGESGRFRRREGGKGRGAREQPRVGMGERGKYSSWRNGRTAGGSRGT